MDFKFELVTNVLPVEIGNKPEFLISHMHFVNRFILIR